MLGLFAAVLAPVVSAGPVDLFRDDFTSDLHSWIVQEMHGGHTYTQAGSMVIEDGGGCTVWFREKLVAPVEISYDVTVVAAGGPDDRVSDVNCFWMATDPRSPQVPPLGRTGKFSDYDSLVTYYVGCGGNENTTTRFRRYDGSPARPLLPENDLREKKFLLEANATYHIRLVARDGTAEFWRDGVKIFSFHDPAPLTSGWFGFRTVKSHLVIRNFRVAYSRS